MLNILETVPLIVFLISVSFIDKSIPMNWEGPFVLSGFVALAVILVFLYRKLLLNRIFLGINLYLFSGGLAFITHQWWLNQIYDSLQASGVLIWVIGIGVISTLISSKGFIGVESPDKKTIKKYSFFLLAASAIAFALSFGFQGNRILSESIPFVGLFLVHSSLKARLTEKE